VFDAHKHGALPLVADIKAALQELQKALAGHRVTSTYEKDVAAAKQEWQKLHAEIANPKRQGALLHQADVIRVLNEETDEASTIVHAAGGLPGDVLKLWKSKAPGDYHSEYGYSCMGYEIAGALGVKLAQPKREVYAFLGDGSYLMLNHEIVTSLQERQKITVVLVDNHGFQCIHNLQQGCGGDSFGNEFRQRTENGRLEGEFVEIDFAANARSLGAKAFTAKTEEEVRQALRDAKKEGRTCVIHIPIEPRTGLPGYSWWDVPVAEVSPAKNAQQAREAYEKGLLDRKLYY